MNTLKNKGFGLIEVLVALAIMAVGLLAIAAFQSSLVTESAESKHKAEAIAIAQNRIEHIRNYTDIALSAADFNTEFPVTADFSNTNTHQGLSALFTQSEKITANGKVKDISVQVSWETPSGTTESVILDSEISWQSPSLPGALDSSNVTGPLVRSATGRAELGKGEVTADDAGKIQLSNGDTTGLLDRGDGDLRLTTGNEEGDDVVLTLKDACDLGDDNFHDERDAACTGFVEISGTVYIDTNSYAANSAISPKDIYVIASDAAYCQRYYMDGDTPVKVDADTADSDIPITAGNDYNYFNYTCYLGGGWHGNIGIISDTGSGTSTTGPEWACMGDPNSATLSMQPAVAIRRVYRGMAYLTDDAGDTIYYSVGVADNLILPADDDAGHDFVIANLTDSSVTACEEPMNRADSASGTLFTGVPTDFFCLNQDITWVDSVKMLAFGYQINNFCPFDPSDPPSSSYIVSGLINVESPRDISGDVDAIAVNTSDGVGNCTQNPSYFDSETNTHTIQYQCTVYDWEDKDGNLNGWDGNISIDVDESVFTCDSERQSFTALIGDTPIDPFNCVEAVEPTTIIVKGDYKGGTFNSIEITDLVTPSVTQCDIDTVYLTYRCEYTPMSVVVPSDISIEYNITSNSDEICLATPTNQLSGTITDNNLNNKGVSPAVLTLSNVLVGITQVDIVIDNITGSNVCPN